MSIYISIHLSISNTPSWNKASQIKKWFPWLSIWVNYNNSPTWIKAIWGWFPLLTMIPGLGRSEVVIIYPDPSFQCCSELLRSPARRSRVAMVQPCPETAWHVRLLFRHWSCNTWPNVSDRIGDPSSDPALKQERIRKFFELFNDKKSRVLYIRSIMHIIQYWKTLNPCETNKFETHPW